MHLSKGQPLARDLKQPNYVIITVQCYKFDQLQIIAVVKTGEKLKLLKFYMPPDCTTADMQGGFATIVEHFKLLHHGA